MIYNVSGEMKYFFLNLFIQKNLFTIKEILLTVACEDTPSPTIF